VKDDKDLERLANPPPVDKRFALRLNGVVLAHGTPQSLRSLRAALQGDGQIVRLAQRKKKR